MINKNMFYVTNHQGNTNHNPSELSPHTWQDGSYQKKRWLLGRMCENYNNCLLLETMQIVKLLLKTRWRVPQKLTIELPYDLALVLWVFTLKNFKEYIGSCRVVP